jgi:2-dehydro-3-deoxyphosphogluconate aldolase/(4S)-4-hydroxy-2-oxoglutarate aldolase
MDAFLNTFQTTLYNLGILPVVEIETAEAALGLGQALLAGGLPCAEITFRTAAAEESIKRLKTGLPELMVGAGTVLSVEQAGRAIQAGAGFVVSPGFDGEIVEYCLSQQVPVIPGAVTATEIMMALRKGARLLKFFPAETLGGVAALKALSAPFKDVRFVPTGGIEPGNLEAYLRTPGVTACGGTWMVKKNLIAAGDFDTIARLAREVRELVRRVREA